MAVKNVLETERLVLREITPADAVWAYELNADPLVLEFTGDEPFANVKVAEQFLKEYDHYRKYGFGRWGVSLKNKPGLLGWCGLKYSEAENEFDLGYRFMRAHWGRGYATEAGRACIKYGFEHLGMDRIVGRVMDANQSSVNVLLKCDMKYVKAFDFSGQPGSLYEIFHVDSDTGSNAK